MPTFEAFIQAVLHVLIFRRLPPSLAQATSNALETFRAVVLQGSGTLPDLPSELCFDSVLYGQTGSPITRDDFLTYLTIGPRTAENFHVLLFILNYTQLYTNLAAQGDTGLSPTFTEQDEKDVRRAALAARRASRTSSVVSTSTKPPTTGHSNYTEFGVFVGPSSTASSITPPTSAGGEHQPPTSTFILPGNFQLSDEITKFLGTYIRPSSSKMLNISDLDRACLLQSIQQSNHPDVFRLITKQFEPLVRASYLEFINYVVRSPAPAPASPFGIFAPRLIGPALLASSLLSATMMTIFEIRWEFCSALVPTVFLGVVTTFCVEREAFVWCGEELDGLLEKGGAGGKGKRKLRGVVAMQGVWAGVIAAGIFCSLFLLMPQGNKF